MYFWEKPIQMTRTLPWVYGIQNKMRVDCYFLSMNKNFAFLIGDVILLLLSQFFIVPSTSAYATGTEIDAVIEDIAPINFSVALWRSIHFNFTIFFKHTTWKLELFSGLEQDFTHLLKTFSLTSAQYFKTEILMYLLAFAAFARNA